MASWKAKLAFCKSKNGFGTVSSGRWRKRSVSITNEQMKAIQKELGETDDSRDELVELEERIRKTKLSKEAREKADAELKKLRNMSQMSAEATVVRNYLDWLLAIPWKRRSRVKKDITLAQSILDRDHYGLEKV